MRLTCLLFIPLILACCQPQQPANKQATDTFAKTYLKYARGFTVSQKNGHKLVEIVQPYQNSSTSIKYLLVPRGESLPKQESDIRFVQIPIASIVCTSTTHIPLLDYLEESESLVGFPTTDYISSEITRARVDAGNVTELGIDKGMDLERIALLKPDVVMGYTLSGDFGQFKKIEALGIPVILNAEYLEPHPLGRAEWIKFMALFYNKEEMADSIFNAIEQAYLETQLLVSTVTNKPTVMSGIVYGDAWFLPGGKNYAAQFFQDAGYRYLWSDNDSQGFLELSFESVFEKAHAADFWIGVASFKSLKEIENADKRYTKFKPFQTGNVFTYDARKGAKGGSEFLELGYLRPDIILKDLVRIAHPELLPDYSLFFHKRLTF
jgi:iron complex transport system substrate-binding protein